MGKTLFWFKLKKVQDQKQAQEMIRSREVEMKVSGVMMEKGWEMPPMAKEVLTVH